LNNIETASLTVNICSQFHHFIIDECDNLSRNLHQKRLRNIMNVSGCIFYLTTNHLHRIDGGIASRCHIIDCDAAPPHAWLSLFARVLQNNGASVPSASVLLPSIYKCNGSVRDIISEAQKLAVFLVAKGHTFQTTSAPVAPIVPTVMNRMQFSAATRQVP